MRGRVRWGNVGRVLGVVGLVGVVVAWPRLGGDAVVVPGDDAVPIVAATASPAPRVERPDEGSLPDGATRRRGEARPRGMKPVRRRERRRKPRPAAPPPAPPAAPAPPPVAAPPAAAAPAPTAAPAPAPTLDPAEREFGFER
jgi:hypothetical protein